MGQWEEALTTGNIYTLHHHTTKYIHIDTVREGAIALNVGEFKNLFFQAKNEWYFDIRIVRGKDSLSSKQVVVWRGSVCPVYTASYGRG